MRFRISTLTVFTFVCLMLGGFTQALAQGSWTTKAPMPTPRVGFATGVVNGILYAAGGYNGGYLSPSPNEAYDPVANTWVSKAPMPTPREIRGGNGAVVNGILYVIGGNNGFCLSTVEAYNPSTNSWSTKASMPTPRCHLALAAAGGLIYAIGGTNTSGSIKYATVEVYNPSTNSWTTAASMPTGRQDLIAIVINGLIYAVGGGNPAFPNGGFLATNEIYNPATNTWAIGAPMPTARALLAGGAANGRLYAVGGSDATSILATNEAYDPGTDTWTTDTSMPTARTSLGAGVINNVLYAVGGGNSTSALATNEAFTPITLACAGFDSPFDVSILIKAKVQRAIPLKMQLSESGTPITDLNIPGAAPVVDVSFSAGGGPAVDVTGLLEPVGQSSDGNTFSFDAGTGRWVFNLGSKPFSAAGTYTVTAKAGDTSYGISPSCSGQFIRGN